MKVPYYECEKCEHEFNNYNSEGKNVWPSKCPKCDNDGSKYKIAEVVCAYPLEALETLHKKRWRFWRIFIP
jgi:DNA replicative helicase MCM subunit Mcm2 (Cdc46/Mcm family)